MEDLKNNRLVDIEEIAEIADLHEVSSYKLWRRPINDLLPDSSFLTDFHPILDPTKTELPVRLPV